MNQKYDCTWAGLLRDYALDSYKDAKNYAACVAVIEEVGDGFFEITRAATCRFDKCAAVLQIKDLPWEYLFNCMKLSNKDFRIMLPKHLADKHFKTDRDGGIYVYAWYDNELDAIQVFEETGKFTEEEDTTPGYDGYGRFVHYYERIRGVIDKNCNWKVDPYICWGSLYTL